MGKLNVFYIWTSSNSTSLGLPLEKNHFVFSGVPFAVVASGLGSAMSDDELVSKPVDVSTVIAALGSRFLRAKISFQPSQSFVSTSGMEFAKSYFDTNDSVQREEIIQETAQLEQLYQKEKREREIAELQIQNDRTDLDLEKKKSQNYLLYFFLGSALFILITGYLTYRNRQKKAQLKEQAQNQEIQYLKAEQERKLFGVMMDGVEQERKRLAGDLHDGLGGRLSGISIKLSKLSEVEKIKKAAPELTGILENIDDSLQELRGVARNLMPETLFKYGLKAALEDYCSTLQDKDTKIVLQYYSTKEISDKNKKLTLYRIIQELINNAVKHAKATEILVQFINDNNKIDITVEDDGVGFEATEINEKNGLGLSNLKNRVHFLSGKMDIRSVINEGSSINIQIEKL